MTHIRTWADDHPEVFETFSKPPIAWPCEQIRTELSPVFQPTIVRSVGQELFSVGTEGQVYHSQDLGRSWSLLATAPPLHPKMPEGLIIRSCNPNGIGTTREGTLLVVWGARANSGNASGQDPRDESYHAFAWITRSTDRGQTWESTDPFDPEPFDVIGDQTTPVQLRGGRLLVPFVVQRWARSGSAIDPSNDYFRSLIFSSNDDGRSWTQFSRFTDHSPEPSLLELPEGNLVASIRYQRNKTSEDPPELATDARLYSGTGAPTDPGCHLFQNTAFSASQDGGRTWATPRIVTASAQQSGSILRLSDGTLILTFGRYGQRFMLSYDSGVTWSRDVYELYRCGQYARSIVLDDDTVITVHDSRETWNFRGQTLRCYDNSVVPHGEDVTSWGSGRLGILRWNVPNRSRVELNGFFTPRDAETRHPTS